MRSESLDVVVDLDGTIRLRGNTPAIYINGRPAPMDGVAGGLPGTVPADRIERIEVLDTPGARYGAEGAAGIINIVLKEGVELGLTGSLSRPAPAVSTPPGDGAPSSAGPWCSMGGWMRDGATRETPTSSCVRTCSPIRSPSSSRMRSGTAPAAMAESTSTCATSFSKKSRLSTRFNGNLNGNARDGLTETTQLDELQA